MSEQQQTNYYDKLLHHLNRTFQTNMKAQELYLDLVKHSRKIRFKSIKNIYNTLTEGKADEVIYAKDKPILISQDHFNHKYSQRISWRLIEKLVMKISYYLINQRNLGDLAPHIVKIINFTRNANDKISNRGIFTQFFSEVVDTIIAQNNVLEQKIYDLLIKRGYIYSIDQFYRMNRFQGPNMDYVYSNGNQKQKENNYTVDQVLEIGRKNKDGAGGMKLMHSQKSKRGFVSIKTIKTMKNSQKNKGNQIKQQDESQQHLQTEAKFTLKHASLHQQCEQQSDKQQQQPNPDMLNKLNHNIHIQVDKVAEEIMNNQHYQNYLLQSQEFHTNDQASKEPVIKSLLKNLKLKNFKANQKILTINRNHFGLESSEEIKNSTKRVKTKPKGLFIAMNKNRTSIATALSKRLKQNIFHNEQLNDIQNLLFQNLGKLQSSISSQKSNTPHNIVRSNARQQTQNVQLGQKTPKHEKYSRRASNMNFLSNAFVFNTKQSNAKLNANNKTHLQRLSNFAPDINMSQISSYRTVESCSNNPNHNTKSQFSNANDKHVQASAKSIATRFQDHLMQNKLRKKKKGTHMLSFKDGRFNTAMLEFAAKKYNKCSTEGVQHMGKVAKQLDIFGQGIFQIDPVETPIHKQSIKCQHYQHNKKYELYDRINRKIVV